MSELTPNSETVRRHLHMLADGVRREPDLKVEIAWGLADAGPRHARLFRVRELGDAADFACVMNQSGCNVYVGTTIKRADCPSGRRTNRGDAVLGTCLPIDIDHDLVAGARRLPMGIKPQLLVISGRKPVLRGHLWIGLCRTKDLERLEEVAASAIVQCGGDMAARGRSQLMRLAGTISLPPEKKKKRGYCSEQVTGHFVDAPAYTLEVLALAFSQRVSDLAPPHDQGKVSAFASPDVHVVQVALNALPYAYVENHDLWIRVGLALHAFDPGLRGLLLWKEFSRRCPEKAALTNFQHRWTSFSRQYSGRRITIGWLFGQAKQYGRYRPPSCALRGKRL